MTITPPYVDKFGRGYLISVTCPVAGPSGAVVGVAGADVLVSSLQEVVKTIYSRDTGEAHFFVRATGEVVASNQLDMTWHDHGEAAYHAHVQTNYGLKNLMDLKLPGSSSTFGQFSLLDDPAFTFDAEGGGSTVKTVDGYVYSNSRLERSVSNF